ncbi:hypothetical protein EDB84DRAFT_1563802 [Lactarius hengduanensis]|nr:hypothetical protein EDB84DRAFT_1563802 [Lactarius hengduanensis]KAH9032290.1 hypothetical protein EDB85DRAFT_1263373 [Lactarius pseudohatsudake]
MPSTTISELDTLFHHLQRRMVESGEWERILLQLRHQLSDAGWLDSTRAKTLEHGHGMEQSSFRELLDGTRMRTQDVPEAVKLQIVTLIRSFVDKQFE